jgi:hypothetical protein
MYRARTRTTSPAGSGASTWLSVRDVLVGAALALGVCAAPAAHAEGRDVKQAGAAYNEGVKLFEQARYADAARAFLRADDLAPSSEALSSAMAAARRGSEHLLVARAADRALAREAQDEKLAAQARQALSEAARHLARLRASCEPTPCELTLDGDKIEAGQRYVLPGTHRLEASGRSNATAQDTLELNAGATYEVVLRPTTAAQPAGAASSTDRAAPAKPALSPESNSAQSPQTLTAAPQRDSSASDRPISPGVFYAAIVVDLALIGLTAWSGFDTLAARDDLPQRPTEEQVDDVTARVRRTDLLLLGSIVMTGLTTYAGVMLVDFGGSDSSVAVVPLERGMYASATGRF